jgi:hypothetical protein
LLEARQRGFEHGMSNRPASYERNPDAEVDRAYSDGRKAGEEAAKAIERRAERRLADRVRRHAASARDEFPGLR